MMKKIFYTSLITLLILLKSGLCLTEEPIRLDLNKTILMGGNYYQYNNTIFIPTEEHHVYFRPIDTHFNSFKLLNEYFAVDKNHVFFKGEVLKRAHRNSFQALKETPFARDKNQAFYGRNSIPQVDLKSFEILNHFYARDKNHIFHEEKILNHVDTASFRVFEKSATYTIDKNHAYHQNHPIKGADLNSFEGLGSGYARDKNQLYCFGNTVGLNGKPIDYDHATFEIIKESGIYGKDKDGVYRVFTHCGPKKNTLIKKADPDSFEEVFIHQDAFYTKDKNHVYLFEKIIEEADPSSFRVLNIYYSMDKNKVFREEKPLKGVDPRKFDPKTFNYEEWKKAHNQQEAASKDAFD